MLFAPHSFFDHFFGSPFFWSTFLDHFFESVFSFTFCDPSFQYFFSISFFIHFFWSLFSLTFAMWSITFFESLYSITFFFSVCQDAKWFRALLCSLQQAKKSDFNHFFVLCAKPKKVIWITFFLLCVASRKSDFNHFFCSVRQAQKVIWITFFFPVCPVAKVIPITFLFFAPRRKKWFESLFSPLCTKSPKWFQSLFCSLHHTLFSITFSMTFFIHFFEEKKKVIQSTFCRHGAKNKKVIEIICFRLAQRTKKWLKSFVLVWRQDQKRDSNHIRDVASREEKKVIEITCVVCD